ncbi:MAG: transketolase family protein [Planctomycetota bacterium]|jgi:transketolase|nr:transketolase family protein [Planctomycetota bacterium]
MKAIRAAYGEALVELAGKYDFFVMDADLAKGTMTVYFRDAHPDRFIDMGIAEANMYGYAAGLSSCGVPVFASTFASFAAGRSYDQIRNGIAYPRLNVKVAATHGGVQAGADGGSHQCLEDIALMRAIPGMVVLCPCDERETKAAVETALRYDGPVYLRLARNAVPDLHPPGTPCEVGIGRGNVIVDGDDAAIVAVGGMVAKAVEASGELRASGIGAAVVSMVSIKPLDEELLLRYARKTGRIVTAEDHNRCGGLGGAVSEALALGLPTPLEMVAVDDEFGCSGSPDDLDRRFNLTAGDVCAAVDRVLKR